MYLLIDDLTKIYNNIYRKSMGFLKESKYEPDYCWIYTELNSYKTLSNVTPIIVAFTRII
jgi:hypothetical protein